MQLRHATIAPLLALSFAPSPLRPFAPSLAQLTWMTGCWERNKGDVTWEESWSPVDSGVMYGSGRTTRNGALMTFEITNIFVRNDSIVYAADPAGQKPAEFRTTEASSGSVTFSNPTHDFPQRVIYRKGADSLYARIEGKHEGRDAGVDYPYKRVSCGDAVVIERTVRGLDSLWAHNYEVHDTLSALKLMGDEFTMSSSNGTKKTRADELLDVRGGEEMKMHYFRTRDVVVKTTDHTAAASGIAEWSFDWKGKTNTTVRRYAAKYRRGGPLGWRLVNLQIMRME